MLAELDEDDVREAARKFRQRGIEAVAVAFLNSFMNPAHETRAKEILLEEFGDRRQDLHLVGDAARDPGVRADLDDGCQRLPDAGDRDLSRAARAGAIGLGLQRSDPRHALRRWRDHGPFRSPCARSHLPLRACRRRRRRRARRLSRPATRTRSRSTWAARALTWRSPRAASRRSRRSGGLTGTSRSCSRRSISSRSARAAARSRGSTSVARCESVRNSAGADPGPAALGRGNEQPTITDAHLVLGRLNPDRYLGRRWRSAPRARRACDRRARVEARHVGGRDRERDPADRQRQHDGGDASDLGPTRPRPARFRARRRRRRGSAARGRHRPRARDPAGGRAAGAGRHVGAGDPAGRPPPRHLAFGARTGRRHRARSSSGGCSPSWSPRRGEILDERADSRRATANRAFGRCALLRSDSIPEPCARRDARQPDAIERARRALRGRVRARVRLPARRRHRDGRDRQRAARRGWSVRAGRLRARVSVQRRRLRAAVARGLLRRGRRLHRHADLRSRSARGRDGDRRSGDRRADGHHGVDPAECARTRGSSG